MVSRTFFASSILALTTTLAEARVSVDRENTWYPIAGSTPRELLNAMAQSGPRDPVTGHKSWAITRWFINWRYGLKKIKNGCELTNVRTSVTIKMNLPRIKLADAAAPHLGAAWRKTFNSLLDHEEGHARNGLMAAYDIDWALETLPPAKDCKSLSKTANNKARAIIAKYQKRDRDFDIKTRNGRSTIVPLKKPRT